MERRVTRWGPVFGIHVDPGPQKHFHLGYIGTGCREEEFRAENLLDLPWCGAGFTTIELPHDHSTCRCVAGFGAAPRGNHTQRVGSDPRRRPWKGRSLPRARRVPHRLGRIARRSAAEARPAVSTTHAERINCWPVSQMAAEARSVAWEVPVSLRCSKAPCSTSALMISVRPLRAA